MKLLPALAATAALLALTPAPAHADDEIVARLEALADPASAGGAAITADEVRIFADTVPPLISADEALLGIVVANRLRFEVPFADGDYATLQTSLRHRVDGLAVSLLRAPGVRFRRADAAAPLAVDFDAQGVAFSRVELVYSWDGWWLPRAATLAPDADGTWRAALEVAPATGRLAYALHVFGRDGRDFWLNYGVENGVGGGQAFLDYSLTLAATEVMTDVPSQPVLAKLVRMFTHPASPGGHAVVSDEFSAMVEQVTWEGGPAIQDDDVLNPAILELEAMVAAGVDFAIDHELMTGFLDRQRLRYGTLPGMAFVRGADGQLGVDCGSTYASAEIYYSTDGWNLPHSERCTRDAAGSLACTLGYLPRGALLAYAVRLVDGSGQVHWQHLERGLDRPSNFFHKLP